jgi:hypothetical protein
MTSTTSSHRIRRPGRPRRTATFAFATATALGAAAGPALASGSAGAAPTPNDPTSPTGTAPSTEPAAPTMTISPDSGSAGTVIGVNGTCPTNTRDASVSFGPDQSDATLAQATPALAADGSFASSLTVPEDILSVHPVDGGFSVLLICDVGDLTHDVPKAMASFHVVGATPPSDLLPAPAPAPAQAPTTTSSTVPVATAPDAIAVSPAFTG